MLGIGGFSVFFFYLSNRRYYVLTNALQDLIHAAAYELGGHGMVGKPDESHVDSYVLRKRTDQQVLLQAIGFTNLTLSTIAIYGMMQMALRDAEQHFYLRASSLISKLAIGGTQGKSAHRSASRAEK